MIVDPADERRRELLATLNTTNKKPGPLNMQITPELIKAARFASPLSTAVAMSMGDPVPYSPARHLKLISDKITAAVYSGNGRLIITTPPRHGKSWMVSKWTPVWFLAKFPHKLVMNCGYGSRFAKKWGREVRNVVAAKGNLLPFQLSLDSKAADMWKTDKDGGVLTAGIGGSITGEGADLMLIDDPIKNWKEASSYTYREATWEWYTSTARTRLHPKGTIIVVLTRWNEDDLAGRLLKNNIENWDLINLPAIYDEYAQEQGPDPLGRQLGEFLWPERYGKQEFDVLKQQDKIVWESLYQQRPGTVAGLGNVYHGFDEKVHVKDLDRDVTQRMFLSVDFNVDPMCWVYGQYREYHGPLSHLTNEKYAIIEVLGEQALSESNTLEACQEFYEKLKELCGNYEVRLEIYGDASGASRHTSQTSGSDWDIISSFFRSKPNIDLSICNKSKNPSIKDRVNSVNTRFKNQLGEVGMFVDRRCKMLIRDLKNVVWKKDVAGNTTGQLDKSQTDLTHMSDSLGYFIEYKWGRAGSAGERAGFMQ